MFIRVHPWLTFRNLQKPVVTEITKATEWWPAEDYHQKYLVKNPGGYNCHVLRD